MGAVPAVDAVLEQLRALLGHSEVPELPVRQFGTPIPPVPTWLGSASAAADTANAAINVRRTQLADTHTALRPLLHKANALATTARQRLQAIAEGWLADQHNLATAPAGQAALLHAGAQRIADATAVLTATQQAYTQLAAQVTALTRQLPTTTGGAKFGTQLVDYRFLSQAPPPDPATPTGADITAVLQQLPAGNNPNIREVRTPQDSQNLWQWAIQGGTEIPTGYGDPSRGTMFQLPDGTTIGRRSVASSNGQPVLDFQIPGQDYTKVHVNPRGGVPNLPLTPAAPEPDSPWGTYISPKEAARSGDEIGNLGKLIESFYPPDPNDPDNTA